MAVKEIKKKEIKQKWLQCSMSDGNMYQYQYDEYELTQDFMVLYKAGTKEPQSFINLNFAVFIDFADAPVPAAEVDDDNPSV